MVQRSETQTVHGCNRPRAHRKDVAKDSADTGCSALKRLDECRVIVRFDLERRAPAVAEIDNARILTWRNDHSWSSCRQSLQMNARRFIRAVLGPHDRENTEFGKTRFTAKQFLYSVEFLLCEVMRGDNFGSYLH